MKDNYPLPADSGESNILLPYKASHYKYVEEGTGRKILDREKAAIGIFITLQSASKDMIKDAVSAGVYSSPYGTFPRLQILTVEEFLNGQTTAQYPRRHLQTPHTQTQTLQLTPNPTRLTQQRGPLAVTRAGLPS